jgi:hypothetical protein
MKGRTRNEGNKNYERRIAIERKRYDRRGRDKDK